MHKYAYTFFLFKLKKSNILILFDTVSCMCFWYIFKLIPICSLWVRIKQANNLIASASLKNSQNQTFQKIKFMSINVDWFRNYQRLSNKHFMINFYSHSLPKPSIILLNYHILKCIIYLSILFSIVYKAIQVGVGNYSYILQICRPQTRMCI